jgi:hypothetical protein
MWLSISLTAIVASFGLSQLPQSRSDLPVYEATRGVKIARRRAQSESES